jgi:hypothetical protein
VDLPHRIRWRVGLIVASISLATYQGAVAPNHVQHHSDSGANALMHPLGPVLLTIVPLLSLLLLVRGRWRGAGAGPLHVPTFAVTAFAAEAAGIVLGLTHHGAAITAVLAVLGIAICLLTVAVGSSIVSLVARSRRRRWPTNLRVLAPSTVALTVLRGWHLTSAHARRGPPVASAR